MKSMNENTVKNIVSTSIVMLTLATMTACMATFVFMTSTPAEVAPMIYETMWDLWAARIVAFLLIMILIVVLPIGGLATKLLNNNTFI